MAGFVRSKQAGIERDLSGSIRPELFTPDDQARYGINSQIRYAWNPAIMTFLGFENHPHLKEKVLI